MNPSRRLRILAVATALLLPSLLPASALAAGGTTDEFRLAPGAHDGTGSFQLVHPGTGGRGAGYLGGNFTSGEYFADPIGNRRIASIHLGGGFAVADWLRFETDVPFVSSLAEGDQSASGMGDLQFSATVPILFPGTRNFGIGLAPFVEVPTMAETSSEDLQGGALFTIGSGDGTLGWRANAGLRTDTTGSGSVVLGLGGNARLGDVFMGGLELMSSRPAGPADPEAAPNALEATAYGVVGQDRPAAFQFGLTTGLIPEAGSPSYRATVAVSFRRVGLIGDPDGDGVFGLDDACPNTPEDLDGYLDSDGCPEPDDDLDGVADVVDRCPAEAEDRDGHEDRDGCPDVDNDFDGIFDNEDECPDEPGILAANGCPDQDGDTVPDPKDECPTRPGNPLAQGCPDYDKDRVPDFRDLCPTEPISPKIDPLRSNGCPTRAYYSGGRIEILDRVNFEFGSATLSSDSYGVLRDVARTLEANPDIKLIEIGGHTDNVGPAGTNVRLSRARAKAVRDYLVQQGVSARKLSTKGYGESMPIDTNETEAGRFQNRRVEFIVVETVSTGG
jgi:outer membrane protein OmpA-like peptidoglycan-associated protein